MDHIINNLVREIDKINKKCNYDCFMFYGNKMKNYYIEYNSFDEIKNVLDRCKYKIEDIDNINYDNDFYNFLRDICCLFCVNILYLKEHVEILEKMNNFIIKHKYLIPSNVNMDIIYARTDYVYSYVDVKIIKYFLKNYKNLLSLLECYKTREYIEEINKENIELKKINEKLEMEIKYIPGYGEYYKEIEEHFNNLS